jgi:hypothetical protein
MLARRIIAISPDKAFAKQLTMALRAAGGAAETYSDVTELSVGPIDTALLVVHITADIDSTLPALLTRLVEDCPVIAIVPHSNLIELVALLRQSEHIVGVMVAEGLSSHELTAMAARALAGDIFGLEKLIPWGTRVHSSLVADYQEKSVCISAVSEFAQAMGVRRKYRESIEQCLDEMLMNALYDAPVDDQGRQIFADVPTKTRITLRLEQRAVVQYACDGKYFAISVRDTFGMLERATVVKYLHKCLHAEQQIDRKTGGAGLGLYLMANSASRIMFHVLPGVATEAVCTFNLDSPKVALESFAFLYEKIDAAGRLTSGPSRLLGAASDRRATTAAAPRSRLTWFLLAALLATLVTIGIVAIPKLTHPPKASVTLTVHPAGAAIEVEGRPVGVATSGELIVPGLEIDRAYPVVAKLDGYQTKAIVVTVVKGQAAIPVELEAVNPVVHIASTPNGASVEINGEMVGKTPLALARFSPNANVSAILRLDGYDDQPYSFDTPGPGKDKDITIPLSVATDFATISVTSTPPGAEIYLNGQLLAGKKTPSEPFLVKAGVEHSITLKKADFVPARLTAKPARGENNYRLDGVLAPGLALTVTSNLDGKASISSTPECRNVAVPTTCQVKAGDYEVEFSVGSGASVKKKVKVVSATTIAFRVGIVEASTGTSLMLSSGAQAKRVLLEEGRQTVTLLDVETSTIKKVSVAITAGQTLQLQ